MNYEYCNGYTYTIKKGDTLYEISKKENVPLALILRSNPFVDVFNLQVGDTICIPTRERPGAPMPGRPGDGRPEPPMPGRPGDGRPGAPMPGRPGDGRPGAPMPGRPEDGRPGASMPGRPGDGRPGAPMPIRPGMGRRDLDGINQSDLDVMNHDLDDIAGDSGTVYAERERSMEKENSLPPLPPPPHMNMYQMPSAENMEEEWIRYVVQPGDTLAELLKTTDDLEDFVERNGLSNIYLLSGIAYYVPEK